MELHLKIIGWLLMTLSFVHIAFPKYFKWPEELTKLSLINRQMMYFHTFFIALIVFLMGFFCLTSSEELVKTHLGRKISLGFGIFWAVRLFVQFFGYSTKLWKGKIFETTIHSIFSVIWIYLSFTFILIYLS